MDKVPPPPSHRRGDMVWVRASEAQPCPGQGCVRAGGEAVKQRTWCFQSSSQVQKGREAHLVCGTANRVCSLMHSEHQGLSSWWKAVMSQCPLGKAWVGFLQNKGHCERFHQINELAVSIYHYPGNSKQIQFMRLFFFFGFA